MYNLSSSNVKNLALLSFGASPISSPIDPHDAENLKRDVYGKVTLHYRVKIQVKLSSRVHYQMDH